MKANNEAKSGYSRVQFPLVLCVAIIDISPNSQTYAVQSFVVDFVEHVVPEPTGADFMCYQADRWSRGHTRFATKGKKKTTELHKPQQNAKPNLSTLQDAGSRCNHLDISRLFGWMNSTSNQGKEAPTPSTPL